MTKTNVYFHQFPEGDIIALFPDIICNHKGMIESYQHIGQHGAASPELLQELPEAKLADWLPLYRELAQIGYKLNVLNSEPIEYHRNPTQGEIRFGHGATHYAEFPLYEVFKPCGALKKRHKGNDGLIYTR